VIGTAYAGEMSRHPPPRSLWTAVVRAPWRFLFSRWAPAGLLYLLVSAVLGPILVSFGIVLFLFLPLQGIALGHLERWRVRLVGWPRPVSPHVRLGRREWRSWLGVRLGEPGTWRELAYLLIAIVFGTLSLAVLVGLVLTGLLAVMICTVFARNPDTPINLFGAVYTHASVPGTIATVVLAVIALIVFCYLCGLLACAQAALARLLLSSREEELARETRRLQQSRLSLVDAFESERQRIERELHDGVQQRLVALSMQLGIAELELAEVGPAGAGARNAVAHAHAQAEEALSDLRNAVRGIHPQVLADHGLAAAVAEIANRSPIPVIVDLSVERLPSPVETAAYFTVTEALGNALRHSAATSIRITAATTEDRMTITVQDNGNGGANAARGTGLAGLAQRADALGGRLDVSSPLGGPTVLRMTLPRSVGDGRSG
jgi:signal transduction histidine kinase